MISEFIIEHELTSRLVFFVCVFTIMMVWEFQRPRRKRAVSRGQRWPANMGLVLLNTVVVRVLFPGATVGMAMFAQDHQWGLLNYFSVPLFIGGVFAVIILDLVIYCQHVMVHAIPMLWRLHRVHHADPDCDFTTGTRFHPIEMIFSLGVKVAAISLLGPPVLAVIIFEIILNATAMFNHGNVWLPAKLDQVIRWVFVTPDMHRIHHSVHEDETNSNFGFNLSWWDRLLGTYRQNPRESQEEIKIGLHGINRPEQVSRLPGMLMLPFKTIGEGYSINRR